MKAKNTVLNSNQRHWIPVVAGLVLIIIVLVVVVIVQAGKGKDTAVPNCDGPVQKELLFKNDFERLAFLHSFDSSSVKSVFVDFEDDHQTDIEIEDPQTVRTVTDSFFGEEIAYKGVNIDKLDPVFRSMTVTFRTLEEEYTLELYSWTVYDGAEKEDYIQFDGTLFYPTGEHDFYSAVMTEYYYQREKAVRPSILN